MHKKFCDAWGCNNEIPARPAIKMTSRDGDKFRAFVSIKANDAKAIDLCWPCLEKAIKKRELGLST